MARFTLVWNAKRQQWVDRAKQRARAGIHVISDGLDDVLNMADGKRYSSKAAYYRAVRAAGCEIVGNDTKSLKSRQRQNSDAALTGLGHDIKAAIEQLRSR